MVTSIELTPESEKPLDFLASQTGRNKDSTCANLLNAALKIWKITTLSR